MCWGEAERDLYKGKKRLYNLCKSCLSLAQSCELACSVCVVCLQQRATEKDFLTCLGSTAGSKLFDKHSCVVIFQNAGVTVSVMQNQRIDEAES